MIIRYDNFSFIWQPSTRVMTETVELISPTEVFYIPYALCP